MIWSARLALIGLIAVLAFGCGTDADDPENGASDIGEGVSRVAENAKSTVEAVEDVADDLTDEARAKIGAQKSRIQDQVSGYEDQLATLKSTAETLKNEELDGYVHAIETKLDDARDLAGKIATGTGDVDTHKAELEATKNDVKGLFSKATEKASSVKAGLPKLPGGGG